MFMTEKASLCREKTVTENLFWNSMAAKTTTRNLSVNACGHWFHLQN